MRFLYYKSEANTSAVNPNALEAAGMGYLLTQDPKFHYRETMRGPDGKQGALFAVTQDWEPGQVTVNIASQKWRGIPKAPGFYVGYNTDEKLDPSKLLRPDALKGENVETSAGVFQIPIARDFDAETGEQGLALPSKWEADDNGNWHQSGPSEKYSDLWKVAQMFWDELIGAAINSESSTQINELMNSAVIALSTNYRIGVGEVSLLGFMDDTVAGNILKATIALSNIELYFKKKADADQVNASVFLRGPKEDDQTTPTLSTEDHDPTPHQSQTMPTSNI